MGVDDGSQACSKQASAAPAITEEANRGRSGIDQATANLIARVNAVNVTVDEMFLASAEIQKLPLETCDREARTRCLDRVFTRQHYKVIAVNARLEAMAGVVRSGKIRRWVLPHIVASVVFFAAAKAPILLTADEWHFDHEAFVALVLENSAVDGHA